MELQPVSAWDSAVAFPSGLLGKSILLYKEANMAKNKTIINIHTKRYVQEVFEARLREEGFVCPDDKYLCWYRVKNNEILNSIIFCSNWPEMPLLLDIRYEAAPLFIDPIYIQNVNYNTTLFVRRDSFRCQTIREAEPSTNAPYSADSWVMAPVDGGRGVYTFDEILLPLFEKTVSIADCYSIHKQYHIDKNKQWGGRLFSDASWEFIDEAIYLGDSEIYPYCRARIEYSVNLCKAVLAKKPNNQQVQDALQHWQQLHVALFDDAREEYLGILERRKEEITKKLRKRFGIEI